MDLILNLFILYLFVYTAIFYAGYHIGCHVGFAIVIAKTAPGWTAGINVHVCIENYIGFNIENVYVRA